jgi:hypothetical protein
MLEERVSDHCHKRMSMQALPASAFEVIQLLVRLLANPPVAWKSPRADITFRSSGIAE